MNTARKIIGIVAAFVGTALFLRKMDVSGDLIVGLLIGLLPLIISLYQQEKKEEKERRNRLLADKNACVVEMVYMCVSLAKGDQQNILQKMEKQYRDIQPAIISWGSPKVLKAWMEFQTPSNPPEEVHIKFDKFLRATRNQLGVSNSGLRPGEVLSAIVRTEERQKILDACKDAVYEEDE